MIDVGGPILLIAYTARMLAKLARRANYEVIALDYFGDRDLRVLCPGRSLLRDYADKAYSPRALLSAARQMDAAAVVYGASFENHPDLVDQLAASRLLLGNTSDTLRRVRDPIELMQVLREGGFAYPQTYMVEANLVGVNGAGASPTAFLQDDAPGWLWKPLRGGGGTHVTWADKATNHSGVHQQYIEGVPCSFAFVANGTHARVIGLTEQLIGTPEFGASGFRWCGNLSPPRVDAAALQAMWAEAQAIAARLTTAFGLHGINGVDFIWHADRIWTIEVNPRLSASLELFDMAYAAPVFDWHVRGCLGQELPDIGVLSTRAFGKAVIFASTNVTTGDTQFWANHDLCDIPHDHEHILRDHPICTALVEEETADACLTTLHARADLVRQWVTCD